MHGAALSRVLIAARFFRLYLSRFCRGNLRKPRGRCFRANRRECRLIFCGNPISHLTVSLRLSLIFISVIYVCDPALRVTAFVRMNRALEGEIMADEQQNGITHGPDISLLFFCMSRFALRDYCCTWIFFRWFSICLSLASRVFRRV